MIDWKKKEEEEEEEEEANHQTGKLIIGVAEIFGFWLLICCRIYSTGTITLITDLVWFGAVVLVLSLAYYCILDASSDALRESAQLFGNDPQICGRP